MWCFSTTWSCTWKVEGSDHSYHSYPVRSQFCSGFPSIPLSFCWSCWEHAPAVNLKPHATLQWSANLLWFTALCLVISQKISAGLGTLRWTQFFRPSRLRRKATPQGEELTACVRTRFSNWKNAVYWNVWFGDMHTAKCHRFKHTV